MGLNPSRLYAELGWTYYRMGNFEKSIANSEKAVSGDSLIMYARYNVALAYLCLGQPDKAKEIYLQSKELDERLAQGSGIQGAIGDLQELIDKNIRKEDAAMILKSIFTIQAQN